jgi:sulfite reductase (ferredoxin)
MKFYDIPDTLHREIDALELLIDKYRKGEMGDGELRAHRVPFGVYEQRTSGTYMVRIRCPGGAIGPDQLKRVAELSRRYGSEQLHVTTRQEVQIHDVSLDDVVPLLRELKNVGLSSRGGGGNTGNRAGRGVRCAAVRGGAHESADSRTGFVEPSEKVQNLFRESRP